MSARPVLFALTLGVLAGCSLAPHYQRPTVPAPASAYKEAGDWKVAAPADGSARGPWWQMFNDPGLDALEAQVSTTNQNLKASLARLDQARAQTRIERSAWFPTVDAQAECWAA
jgi:multidrug efflux system outer membrane protein